MVVTPKLRAQILRLYLADQWRIGTISRQLHLHRDTVRRCGPWPVNKPRASTLVRLLTRPKNGANVLTLDPLKSAQLP